MEEFDEWLIKITGGIDIVESLFKFFGMMLSKRVIKYALLMWGPNGDNAKTTIMEFIIWMCRFTLPHFRQKTR